MISLRLLIFCSHNCSGMRTLELFSREYREYKGNSAFEFYIKTSVLLELILDSTHCVTQWFYWKY